MEWDDELGLRIPQPIQKRFFINDDVMFEDVTVYDDFVLPGFCHFPPSFLSSIFALLARGDVCL